MPFSIRGFGTIFYGERDYGINGSHITTEWFAIAYIPIAPLRSIRILPTAVSPGYTIVENTNLNPRQVFYVYGLTVFVVCCGVAVLKFDLASFAIPALAALCAPWILRHRALNRMKRENERKSMGLAPKIS
jgi:hypothetical protein